MKKKLTAIAQSSFNLTEVQIAEEILSAEIRMNTGGKLRFHITDVADVKEVEKPDLITPMKLN